jgi:hypothetical protein
MVPVGAGLPHITAVILSLNPLADRALVAAAAL